MIRKQLYITSEQERALKDCAQSGNQSEAGIVREALVAYLTKANGTGLRDDQALLAQELVKANVDLSRNVSLGKGYVFDRNEGYKEREARRHRNAERR